MGVALRQEQCPECAAQGKDTNGDNLSVYEDGAHCHACGYHVNGVTEVGTVVPKVAKDGKTFLSQGGYQAIPSRRISEATCRTMGYHVSKMSGAGCYVAQFLDDEGRLVGQKVRLKGKEFRTIGDCTTRLWGKPSCNGERCLVITEGEIDALSYKEVFPTWDVVSVPNGCKSAVKAIQANLEWVSKFEEVIIAFDNDDPGREAAASVVPLLPIGRVKIAKLDIKYKDFNDALVAGDAQAIKTARFGAVEWRPDGILSALQVKAQVDQPPVKGKEYPWPTLTKHTYGIRRKEMVVFGAGTGMGKTEFFKQIASSLVAAGDTVGMIHLEESGGDTALGIMNKVAGRAFHIPDAGWTREERDAAFDATVGSGRVHIYDSFGACDYDTVESKVRYMVRGLGCTTVFLDHLTALTDAEEDDRRVNQRMRNIVSSLAGLTRELDFTLFAISHLRKSSGTPHEEGGRVHLDDLYGAAAIKQWCSFAFGLERNQQAEVEEERHTTTLRVLKDRYTGRALGKTIPIRYEQETTRLLEVEGGLF